MTSKLGQVTTEPTTRVGIMRTAAFARGVADVRASRPPRYDAFGDDDTSNAWNYERGRQWAVIAPLDLPLSRNGRLNPAALAFYVDIP